MKFLLALFLSLAPFALGGRHSAQTSPSAESSYGANGQQTLRLFQPTAASPQQERGAWILWWFNSGYAKNDQLDAIGPGNEPLATLLAAGYSVVTATVTYPGQPGVAGGGRFLPPEHPSFALGDRVERDAIAGTQRALELAPSWGLDPTLWISAGRSGGAHPALWATYRTWAALAQKPRGVLVIGAHTWWPAWRQDLTTLPVQHFYHFNDTSLTGLLKAGKLSQTLLEHQIASSFLHYAEPIAVPCLWYSQETTTEVSAIDRLPSNAISTAHSPWFSFAGYARLRRAAPHPLHRLLLDPAVAPIAQAQGLPAHGVAADAMPAAVRTWVREVLFAAP
ncbi:MAG: hypothetical protein EPO68_04825 [Planctomycetota bacterium]|nr:MAG: hypothetical protein EPO68_04825 [Planctomycetota bacterium]